MKNTLRNFFAIAITLVLGFWCYYLFEQRQSTPSKSSTNDPSAFAKAVAMGDNLEDSLQSATELADELAETESAEDSLATDETDPGKIDDEWILQYDDPAAMEAALQKAREAGLDLMGVIPGLNAIRLRANNDAQRAVARDLADNASEAGNNYFVQIPLPPSGQEGENYLPQSNLAFNQTLFDYLGVPLENLSWGEGVKIAVLDTSISDHPTFQDTTINQINLIDSVTYSENPTDHGTAVASLISGTDPNARGIAPGADILGIQVLDTNGGGDAFTLAEGIIQAVDSGADIINLSLGSYGDSSVLEQAILYANSNDVVVVAAAGNDGINTIPYPAQYDGVIGVAAVDAHSHVTTFSNYGPEVDIAAPGVSLYTAYGEDSLIGFTGSSASAPLVSATLAKIMSDNPNMTTQQAVAVLYDNSNDAGAPGYDEHFGTGILNVERILNSEQSGIYDAAVADYFLDVTGSDPNALSVIVTVQNRGTEYLSNVQLELNLEGRNQSAYIGNLPVGEVGTYQLLLNSDPILEGSGTVIESRVVIPNNEDTNPSNDTKTSRLKLETGGS